MDSMMAGAPAPAVPPRRLRPEEEAQLAAGQPVVFEDGSSMNPDGSLTPAGDSPNDFMGGPGGGMGMPPPTDPMMGGMPPPAVGGQGDGDGLQITEDPMEARNPLAGPMFRNFRQTANAGFPGTPGGIGGGPAGGDPLLGGAPAPAVEAPRMVQSNPNYSLQGAGDRGASMNRVGPNLGGDAQPGRQISYGRRVYTRSQTPHRQMPGNSPFRRPARDNSPNH